MIKEEEVLKDNLVKLVKHHKKYCEGEDCDISLYLLLMLAKKAGLFLTTAEQKEFI